MRTILTLLLLIPAAAIAQSDAIAPDTQGYEIEISFDDGLAAQLPTIDRTEQRFEERFRDFRLIQQTPRETVAGHFADTKFHDVSWAGETLIPDVGDYTVENLVRAITAKNVNRAAPDFAGTIRYEIDEMKVVNHAVAYLGVGNTSRMSGRITVIGEDGEEESHSINATLFNMTTIDRSYKGDAFAFSALDVNERVGPIIAQFVELALTRVWPEKKEQIHGPILVRLGQP